MTDLGKLRANNLSARTLVPFSWGKTSPFHLAPYQPISERGAHWRSATMLGLMALSFLAALLFIYIFMPGLWLSIMSIDESLDSHESGLALVASRMSFYFFHFIPLPQPYKILGNPFRETGPPANMAKLILLRHKVCHSNHDFPSVISSIKSRFKLQTESGAVPPLHDKLHELTPSPRVQIQSPLGCALENLSEESNIINSTLATIAPPFLNYPFPHHFIL